ncbi:MAG: TrmH family RNA methyltransferase [Prolixibacteraceae bacterium]|jgi:tRNA G18 (ribose-2'-O)-methylase SpoU|nr:TrmH family RNA methyltransferase [Prolixibacteraceae bacterium]
MNINSVDFFKNTIYSLPHGAARPILLAWKLQNPENCGNILRLSDSIGFRKVLFVKPLDNISLRKVRKTAGNSFNNVDFSFISENELERDIPSGYEFVAVETAHGSANIFNTELPSKIVFVVGNESKGIESDFIAKCKHVVHIPLTGSCTSLNVSHAATVAAFEWLRQMMSQHLRC